MFDRCDHIQITSNLYPNPCSNESKPNFNSRLYFRTSRKSAIVPGVGGI